HRDTGRVVVASRRLRHPSARAGARQCRGSVPGRHALAGEFRYLAIAGGRMLAASPQKRPPAMEAEATRAIDRYFNHYAADHQNGANVLIHWVCVPLIVWSVIAALWVIPVPSSLFRPGLWAGMAMLA